MESCGAWVVRPIWMILHQFWFPTMATGASRPLRSALLLLQFRCAAIAKGRLLLSILPIWSIGGEPGCARRRWRPASVPRNPTRSSVEAMTSPPRNINSRQAIRLIRARQFTAVSNAISWQIVIASNDSLISDVALNSDALQNGPIHHR
ncbi:uncharacterized protein LOC125514399 isoform X1 [Triticum urartu]|nr:uncharacterized protein LOC125514399 isoform X1 [Triticum urartu]